MPQPTADHISRVLDRVALELCDAFRHQHSLETVLHAVNRSYRAVFAQGIRHADIAELVASGAREELMALAPQRVGA